MDEKREDHSNPKRLPQINYNVPTDVVENINSTN